MKLKTLIKILTPNKIVIRRLSKGIGDNLMISYLAREIKNHLPLKKIIVETEYPELFKNNPYIHYISQGKHFPFYSKPKYKIDNSVKKHVLDQMLNQFPYPIKATDKKLEMYFSKSEEKQVLSQLPSNYVVLCPSGKCSFASNRKEWGVDRFQTLVDIMPNINFVQIGLPKDPLLKNVIDLRFLGYPLRSCAIIIKNSICGVFLEGGFMHIANAVEKPSVIIFGGAIRPEITGYDSNINLFRKVHCGPCFTSDKSMTICPTMICMKQIEPSEVAEAIKTLLKKQISK